MEYSEQLTATKVEVSALKNRIDVFIDDAPLLPAVYGLHKRVIRVSLSLGLLFTKYHLQPETVKKPN